MRIRIENGKDFEWLQDAFSGYNVEGHIVVGVDGVWFVVDEIIRREKR